MIVKLKWNQNQTLFLVYFITIGFNQTLKVQNNWEMLAADGQVLFEINHDFT